MSSRSLHQMALDEAELVNPGGEHRVTSIEINGDPDEPGDAVVEVTTLLQPYAHLVDCSVTLKP